MSYSNKRNIWPAILTGHEARFCDAFPEHFSRHAPDEVTQAMNRAVDKVEEPIDDFARFAARRVLERNEW